MEEEYINKLDSLHMSEEDDDDGGTASSTTAFGGNKSKMVGFSDQFHEIRDKLLGTQRWGVLAITGMAGIGKTTIAMKIFEDLLILRKFECRAFVRVGQKYQSKEILQAILAQVSPDSNKKLMEGDENELGEHLRETLNCRIYLIVLDDLWSLGFWYYSKRINLLHEIAFGVEMCPPKLEKLGKKIAENCEGLPLLIVIIANLLSKAERTPKYWDKVAANKENSIFTNAYDQITKSHATIKLKTCSLHSVFWHLCKREAWNNKFLHIFNSYSDAFAEDIKNMQRLCIYKNILFGIKDVYNSMASISTAHLLLCTGPHHQYQVPMCFNLRLLKVLDVLSIRFYEFPVEVLKLIYLRYLALTCNANLPPSISKLWNLQCLIVYQYLSIKCTVVESYLPVEVWYLQELNYLHIMGRNLPDPPHDVVLGKLLTLLDVGAQSCTKCVLESIPNLSKLRVQIELEPDVTEPPSYSDHISVLDYKLKSLQCVIMNPNLKSKIVIPPYPLSVFALNLKKLTLSGFGYPWKDMNKIAYLPLLRVLKLQFYAFQGEKWEAKGYGFERLNSFSIEDTDVVQWTTEYKTFPMLGYLSIKNCYKLQQLPEIPSLSEIHLVDCNPLAMTCAKQMEEDNCRVYAHSSFFT